MPANEKKKHLNLATNEDNTLLVDQSFVFGNVGVGRYTSNFMSELMVMVLL
jgi:hypothetical protein